MAPEDVIEAPDIFPKDCMVPLMRLTELTVAALTAFVTVREFSVPTEVMLG